MNVCAEITGAAPAHLMQRLARVCAHVAEPAYVLVFVYAISAIGRDTVWPKWMYRGLRQGVEFRPIVIVSPETDIEYVEAELAPFEMVFHITGFDLDSRVRTLEEPGLLLVLACDTLLLSPLVRTADMAPPPWA